MAWDIASPNTGATLAAQADPSVLYRKTLDVYEQTEDFWQQFEGRNRNAVVVTEDDTSKGAGQTIKIRSLAGFYNEAKTGDELFDSEDDFEEFIMGDYSVVVDFHRWAMRMTERSEEYMGLRGELRAGIPREAAKWLGRLKSEKMFMLCRERASDTNKVWVNAKDATSLLSSDTLSFNEIIRAATILKSQGGTPAHVKVKGDNVIKGYVVIGTTDALYSLETDPVYQSILDQAGERGSGNLLFTGGYTNVRGNMIAEYCPVDHDGHGAVGSVLNPKAFIGTAIAAPSTGNEVVELKGGGSTAAAAKTEKLYFKHFPGHTFKFGEGDSLASDAGPHYCLTVNPPTGTDPNKVCMFKYTTGNDGHKITVTERLHSANLGTYAKQTVGGVTWNTGVWTTDVVTNQVSQKATCIPCTEDGVPFGWSLILAKAAAIRGYGKHRQKRGTEVHQDFVYDTYLKTVFGQSLREDAQGHKPGVLAVRHAINYAALGSLPTVS